MTPEVMEVKILGLEDKTSRLEDKVEELSDFKYTVNTLSNTVKDLKVSVDRLTDAKNQEPIGYKNKVNNMLFSFLEKSIWLILGAILLSILKITKF